MSSRYLTTTDKSLYWLLSLTPINEREIQMATYKIVRFYYPSLEPQKVIKKGLSLKEAQEHCKKPETSKKGKWFDGYTEE